MSGLRGKGGVTGDIRMEGAEYHQVVWKLTLERGRSSPSFSCHNPHQIVCGVPQRIYCTVFGVSSPTVVTQIPHINLTHAQIKADGVGRLVILPLYPQFSISTSGSSFRLLEGLLKTDRELQV